MSKDRTSKLNKRLRDKAKQTKTVIALSIILGLFVVSVVLGEWQSISQRRGKKKSGTVTTQSLTASSPSKEYIYAGGRLIATEEPTAVNGNDAQFVSMCVTQETCVPV